MFKRQLSFLIFGPLVLGYSIGLTVPEPVYGPKPYAPEYIEGIQPTGKVYHSGVYHPPVSKRKAKAPIRKPKVTQDLGPQEPCLVEDPTCYLI